MEYLLSEKEYRDLREKDKDMRRVLAHLAHEAGGVLELRFDELKGDPDRVRAMPLFIGPHQNEPNGYTIKTVDAATPVLNRRPFRAVGGPA